MREISRQKLKRAQFVRSRQFVQGRQQINQLHSDILASRRLSSRPSFVDHECILTPADFALLDCDSVVAFPLFSVLVPFLNFFVHRLPGLKSQILKFQIGALRQPPE